ncbi:group II intron reverse transcriptase/maturase [Bradyrhizobium sp. USDA 10063]
MEIPKPDGGVRRLGVPCVVDRLIQQAVLQVLQEQWDSTFSEHSYGFRPGRSAHQAVAQAQRYIAEGYDVVVDLDLERFFDRVNHDILMSRVAARVTDKRVLKLIRAYLNAGVLEDGLIRPVDEGTPQAGPLSPFLSNIVLDDLDKELARRGHRFCRYADDCNIYVRSHRAGERVMASITRFLTDKLRLKVNEAKSAVARPEERKFLGFSIANDGSERRIAPKALAKFKNRVRDINAGREAPIWNGSSKTSRLTSSDGAGTLRSARLLACSQTWKPGFAGDCECISGDNGRTGTSDSRSFAASASRSSPHRLPPVHQRGSGECPGTRRSSMPCATTSLTLSVSPEYWFLGQLNSVEPPRYGPVCQVVWEGWRRETSPYPDQSQIDSS